MNQERKASQLCRQLSHRFGENGVKGTSPQYLFVKQWGFFAFFPNGFGTGGSKEAEKLETVSLATAATILEVLSLFFFLYKKDKKSQDKFIFISRLPEE